MTIHAGVRLEHLPLCQHRVTGIVSRGGGLLAHWMIAPQAENPLYDAFDEILEICGEYDVTILSATGCGRARSPTPPTPRSSPSSTRSAS